MIKPGGVTDELGSVVLDCLKFGDELLWAASETGMIVIKSRQTKGSKQRPESVLGKTATNRAESDTSSRNEKVCMKVIGYGLI